jgi:hypothetical protein
LAIEGFCSQHNIINKVISEREDDACTLAAAGDIDDAFNISATDLLIV